MEEYSPNHIDYALVEDTRPAMYRAMKYWGRKPHNIWSDYIDKYCPENGIVLDPFVGSGITAFESAILGRKVIATDINPLTSFVINTTSAPFYEELFIKAYENIESSILEDSVYRKHYIRDDLTVYNYLWNGGKIVSVRLRDNEDEPIIREPDLEDINNYQSIPDIEIPYWFPADAFPNNPSISLKFIKEAGGNSFEFLWTRRNLYLLSKLFDLIQKQDSRVQDHLMLAFIHILHLSCKMVVPRGEKGDRNFSGSWGRADYMLRKRSMEQNPLILFRRSCLEKQGVLCAMKGASDRIPNDASFHEISNHKISKKALVNYGILDIADLTDSVAKESIDFIITDPPYGGLVQYMDLSQIWLIWLKQYNTKYTPDSTGEITYKKNIVNREEYSKKLRLAFKNLHYVLKDNHYMVVTFHNQDQVEWHEFISAIRLAGFSIEKVTHQYNKRSGESNVSNPYGTSGSDLYIRCIKKTHIEHFDEKVNFKRFIIDKAIEIIANRCEPTEFEFIHTPLLAAMIQEGFMEPDSPTIELKKILEEETGPEKIFCVTKNEEGKAGDYYWFNNPSTYICHVTIPLKDRVDNCVKSIIKRKISLKYSDIVAEVFMTFPDGLTPDPRGLQKIVQKYATKSNGKWKYKATVDTDSSEHTHEIYLLSRIGKRAGFNVFIGRREQPEQINGSTLSQQASFCVLKDELLEYDSFALSRIEEIDCIWIKDKAIKAVFEVENSTDFVSAIFRSSNIVNNVPKFMLIPDSRERELLRCKDPLFISTFKENNWKYITYSSIGPLECSNKGKLKIEDLSLIAKEI